MTTTPNRLADELVAYVPLLRTPITLTSIKDACRNGLSARAAAALIDAWLNSAGNAKGALQDAPADALADLIRGGSSFCEGCREVLPAWHDKQVDDHDLDWCHPCAVTSRGAAPENWRVWAQEHFDTMQEAPGA